MENYQFVQDAMIIPFDTWDMQSMRKNYEKKHNIIFWPFFRHLGRENQNSYMIVD